MASPTKIVETQEAKKTEKKASPKRGVKNPFVYGGTIVILIITIVAFVFIPSIGGGVSSSGQAPNFGSWGGKPITYTSGSYFAKQVSQINDYLKQQGLSEQNYQLYAYQVWRMAFQSAAIRTALLKTLDAGGFRVTDKGLDEAVAKNDAYLDNGVFSIDKYNKTLMATKMSIRSSTKEDLLIRRYYEDVYSLPPSTAELTFVASMAKPQRTISYVALPLSAYPKSEVVTWAKANSDLFRTFGVSRISVTSSESDAKKIRQQVIDNKPSFEDAAKSHSKDAYADKGGDAGTVYYYTFAEGFSKSDDAAKAAALGKGEISPVYKIAEGSWAFFRINNALAAPDFNSDSVINEARAYLEQKEKGTLESWSLAQANKLVTSTDLTAFQKAAKAAGYSLQTAGPFIINTGNPTFYAYNQQIPLLNTPNPSKDPNLSLIESDASFIPELFSLDKGKVGKPLVVGDNVLVFGVTEDKDGTEDETAMVQFAYPYFQQQALDAGIKDSFLKSKKFKDNFSTTFFKIFKTNTQASNNSSTSTTAAPAAKDSKK
ncbi:MAG: SurA N-terminal domain-containing protein [Spirochaetes bacterium]|nr:SurA N-terminal domain-containing protein [Spirochaetota bacterium]